jgi:hypothetical protein
LGARLKNPKVAVLQGNFKICKLSFVNNSKPILNGSASQLSGFQSIASINALDCLELVVASWTTKF